MDIGAIVLGLAGKYPVIMAVLGVMGICRMVFKPAFAFARVVVSATETKKDDEVIDAVERSKAYSMIAFALDYLFSIKLIK